MSRRGVLLVLGLLFAPAALVAQASVDFSYSDSVLAIPIGKSRTVDLTVYTACYGITQYSVTLFLDRSRVHLAKADSVPGYGLPAPAVDSSVTDQYTLSASGAGAGTYCQVLIARLTLSVNGVAEPGSLVSFRLNSATGYSPAISIANNYRSGAVDVCQADKVWGDVDQNLTVNSRDALIALTAAVGLPGTGSFDLTVGDVDGDQQVTSRDALFILSAGIGLSLPYYVYAGRAIPARCAPLAPAPADVVFFSGNGMERVAAGDTARSVIAVPISTNQASTARWSPDGSRIAFECFDAYPWSQDICTISPDGSNLATLRVGQYTRDWAPDWAPDGTRIAFLEGSNYLWAANADGSSPAQVIGSHTVLEFAWSPDGTRLAFAGWNNSGGCCSRRLFVVNADGTNLAEVFPNSYNQSPGDPTWSPASDSVAFFNWNLYRTYKVRASGDTAGVPASPLLDYQEQPDWVTQGIGFRSTTFANGAVAFHRASDGRQLRLTRGATYGGDKRPDFRRPSAVPYVDTVTVTPAADTVGPDSTTQLTIVVKNNDGSTNTTAPVRWVSTDTTIAMVDGTGLVTGKNPGNVLVIGTAGGWRSDTAQITVAVTLASVVTGGFHSCGLTAGGTAYCWGGNTYGQLGNGTTGGGTHPFRVAGGLQFASLTLGVEHTCGLTAAGAAYCWGRNDRGQLGNGVTGAGATTSPVAVLGGLTFAQLDAAWLFTCGVTTSTGTGYCWGADNRWQLGDDTLAVDKSVPTAVAGGLQFLAISAAAEHACGVSTGNLAYCWGDNFTGRLGDSTFTVRRTPYPVVGGLQFATVSAFDLHTCGLSTTNVSYCWGGNGNGQLGDSSTVNKSYPVPVKGGVTFASLVAGRAHTCGVSGSTAYCWGTDANGELGDGGTTDRLGPAPVSGGLSWAALTLSLGQNQTCGITTGNVVYCWGANGSGQLGDGTTTVRLTPARVVGQK